MNDDSSAVEDKFKLSNLFIYKSLEQIDIEREKENPAN